ncbi:hypothetical protein K1X76_12780, partial [bacterium]|nr:hypothetical protein [bacterium]
DPAVAERYGAEARAVFEGREAATQYASALGVEGTGEGGAITGDNFNEPMTSTMERVFNRYPGGMNEQQFTELYSQIHADDRDAQGNPIPADQMTTAAGQAWDKLHGTFGSGRAEEALKWDTFSGIADNNTDKKQFIADWTQARSRAERDWDKSTQAAARLTRAVEGYKADDPASEILLKRSLGERVPAGKVLKTGMSTVKDWFTGGSGFINEGAGLISAAPTGIAKGIDAWNSIGTAIRKGTGEDRIEARANAVIGEINTSGKDHRSTFRTRADASITALRTARDKIGSKEGPAKKAMTAAMSAQGGGQAGLNASETAKEARSKLSHSPRGGGPIRGGGRPENAFNRFSETEKQ